jgi:hypothetical protein
MNARENADTAYRWNEGLKKRAGKSRKSKKHAAPQAVQDKIPIRKETCKLLTNPPQDSFSTFGVLFQLSLILIYVYQLYDQVHIIIHDTAHVHAKTLGQAPAAPDTPDIAEAILAVAILEKVTFQSCIRSERFGCCRIFPPSMMLTDEQAPPRHRLPLGLPQRPLRPARSAFARPVPRAARPQGHK